MAVRLTLSDEGLTLPDEGLTLSDDGLTLSDEAPITNVKVKRNQFCVYW